VSYRRRIAAMTLAAGLAAPSVLAAPAAQFDEQAALATSQAAIGREVAGFRFHDTAGRAVMLERYRGKPLVVSLIYTGCNNTCPVITQTLIDALSAAEEVFGTNAFAAVTVGFDAAQDTPERMRAFRRDQGVRLTNWTFLSGDAPTIDALARTIGFAFTPSPAGYDHMVQTTILDGEGRIYRQVYGDDFAAPSLVEPLKALIFGTEASILSLDGLIDRVRLFCTVYNPSSGRYRFDYSLFIGMAAGLSVLGFLAFLLLREWRRTRAGPA
jgi:protein SCO1